MGCNGSKATASSRPAKKQSAKATLLQEPVVESKVAKLKVGVTEAQAGLSNSADTGEDKRSQNPETNPVNAADEDLQRRLRETLDKALHDGSLATATTTVVMGDQDARVEMLPVAEECIVEEVAPAPAARFPWSCMCTTCA